MKVLIVEDEVVLAESMASYLQKEEHVVETAHNFEQAMSVHRQLK